MDLEAGHTRTDHRFEIVIATVLSISGLLTSWAGYQASLWDGEQAAHYSRANAFRVMASRAQLETDSRRLLQVNLFNSWLQAKAQQNEQLAGFYEARFPPDLKPAFQDWLAQAPLTNPSAPQSPFSTPGYKTRGADEASKLESQADASFAAGQRENQISDYYTQGAVFLATSLFFGGIGQVFKIRPVRFALLAISLVACIVGLMQILGLPTLKPG